MLLGAGLNQARRSGCASNLQSLLRQEGVQIPDWTWCKGLWVGCYLGKGRKGQNHGILQGTRKATGTYCKQLCWDICLSSSIDLTWFWFHAFFFDCWFDVDFDLLKFPPCQTCHPRRPAQTSRKRWRKTLDTSLSLSNAATAPPGAISRRQRRVPLTKRFWQDFTNISQSGAEVNLQIQMHL